MAKRGMYKKTSAVLSLLHAATYFLKTLVWFFPLLLMKNIYPYYSIFLGKREYYFESFRSYKLYRFVRTISKGGWVVIFQRQYAQYY